MNLLLMIHFPPQKQAQREEDYLPNHEAVDEPKINGDYRSAPKDSSNYRPVQLQNIPLPTTGGQVTGQASALSGETLTREEGGRSWVKGLMVMVSYKYWV